MRAKSWTSLHEDDFESDQVMVIMHVRKFKTKGFI